MKCQVIIYFPLELLIIIMFGGEVVQSFKHGMYLDSDSYKHFDNIGIKQCAKRCYAESGCNSINFSKTRFNCTLSHFNSQNKPLLTDSEYIYGDRSDMAKLFSDFVNCPDDHVLLKIHDGRNYCYKTETSISQCNSASRLMWQSNPEVAVSVSSTHMYCSLDRGSLNYTGGTGAAWCPVTFSMPSNEYIQFEFIVDYQVYGVMSQGRGDKIQCFSTYKVTTSNDAITWTQIGGNYTGNNDSSSVVINGLPGVQAKYLRIIPVSYINYPSIRVDLIACRV